VLKGAPTITFSEEGEAFINPTGNPALSKGGAGDVLTGFAGGLAAQGYGLTEAAFFAVYLHGYIADTAALRTTDMDLLAGDLIAGLGEALRDIRDGTDRVYIEKSL
jgi:NAD(P)H-hydrate epimerase